MSIPPTQTSIPIDPNEPMIRDELDRVSQYQKLHLPLNILINYRFRIEIEQKEWPDPPQYLSDIFTVVYHISAEDIPSTDSKKGIELEYSKYIPITIMGNPHEVQSYTSIFKKEQFQVLANIQYLLALPLDELPLHLDEEGPMRDLVAWRFDLPRELSSPYGRIYQSY